MEVSVSNRALYCWMVVEIFSILVALQLDGRIDWGWHVVFVPFWFFDVAFLTVVILKIIKYRFRRSAYLVSKSGVLAGFTLKVLFQVLLCLRTSEAVRVPMYLVLLPVWLLLIGLIVYYIRYLKNLSDRMNVYSS